MVSRVDRIAEARVLTLKDERAQERNVAGAKAAALARATSLGLPVLPGFVVTVDACSAIAGERWYGLHPEVAGAIRAAWEGISDDGRTTVVVRSSSTGEDGVTSSMAGMFRSVLGVGDWTTFLDAMGVVLASAFEHVRAFGSVPMAVLVQPQLEPASGGILFGVDPLSGRDDRLSLAVVRGGPDKLVSGRAEGTTHTLTTRGRLVGTHPAASPAILDRLQMRKLARLAAAARAAFGGPQDIEWAFDVEGQLWMLQSRPVTRVAQRTSSASGPVFGAGPIAETFPDALSPLEEAMWLDPLSAGARHALLLSGARSKRSVERSPLFLTVAGRAAADLGLLGPPASAGSFWRRLDPRPPARRLRASWRVGQLRASLPPQAMASIAQIDQDLAQVPDLRTVSSDGLLRILRNSRTYLVAIHAQEMTMGLLLDDGATTDTAVAAAMRQLAEARRQGLNDETIERDCPTVLSLVAPKLFRSDPLPRVDGVGDETPVALGPAALREGLRLRSRWVQELTVKVVEELATRAHKSGWISDLDQVCSMSLQELEDTLAGCPPTDMARRRIIAGPPLPAAFKLSAGEVVSVSVPGLRSVGVAPGRIEALISHDPACVRDGQILVTRNLDPSLGPLLPRIGGLIAETGNPLSHLAILAREFGVPTVVGYEDALERLPAGSSVLLDGSTGEVTLLQGDLT